MKTILIILAIFASFNMASGDTITLRWDRNSEPNVDRYVVYRVLPDGSGGTELEQVASVDSPSAGAPTADVEITEPTTLVITAVTSDGLESAPSSPVSYSPGSVFPSAPVLARITLKLTPSP